MYDLIIIGSGPGGYVAAAKAGKAGLKTLVIEREELGGICLNKGCIPTKALLASTQRLQEIRDAKEHGIVIDGEISVDWPAMQKRKDKVVSRLNKGIEALFKQSKVEWKQGEAEVLSPTEIKVGSETFKTKKLILATGAKQHHPDIKGLSELYEKKQALTATEMLLVDDIPEKLVILGDDVFAMEYGSMFSALGSEVTILGPHSRLLPTMDAELSEFMKRELKKQKLNLIHQAEVISIKDGTVHYKVENEEHEISFTKLLVSYGNEPNLTGLHKLNLKLTQDGFIQVDEFMKTSVKGVYAIGDVIGKYPLAHVASAEGLVALDDILGHPRAMRYDRLPLAVYAVPEVASVGLTEAQAKEKFGEVKVSKYQLSANGKALAEGDSKGFVKILSIEPYDEVVGVHIAGNKATDLIAEGVLALSLEATLPDLAMAIHAHPTPSEILMEAAASSL